MRAYGPTKIKDHLSSQGRSLIDDTAIGEISTPRDEVPRDNPQCAAWVMLDPSTSSPQGRSPE